MQQGLATIGTIAPARSAARGEMRRMTFVAWKDVALKNVRCAERNAMRTSSMRTVYVRFAAHKIPNRLRSTP